MLEIKCKTRSTKQNFVRCISNILRKEYPNECIGLGGVFCAAKGKLKIHVMPKFSEVNLAEAFVYYLLSFYVILSLTGFYLYLYFQTPLKSDKDVEGWLNFYEMDAPFTCLSVLVSKDPVSRILKFGEK